MAIERNDWWYDVIILTIVNPLWGRWLDERMNP